MKFEQSEKREKIKLYAFLFIIVISVLTLLMPTYNYLQFYKAIEKLTVVASKGPFNFASDYRAFVSVNITVINPTGYSGIGVVSLIFDLCFIKNDTNMTVLLKGYRIWFRDEPGEPLKPYSSVSKYDNLTINFEDKKGIFDEIKALQENKENVELVLHNPCIDICIFLGRIVIPLESVPLNDFAGC